VRAYLPDLRLADEAVAERVTLRHLFTHTGGWEGDYFDDTGRGDDALARIVAQLHECPQIAPLGEFWSYNNAGFYIAGRVIEVITGQTYEQVVQQMVLEPLEMKHSFFFASDAITEAVAAGHLVRDDQPQIALPWGLPRAAHPVGGLISSARDQLRYARFHLGDGTAPDGTRLLAPETMALMHAPQGPGGNDFTAMGIVWRLQDYAGARIVGHGGATNGQMSAFLLVPEHHWAITVLTNADRGVQLHRIITRRALQLFLGLEPPEEPHVALPPSDLAAYAGCYVNIGTKVTVSVDGDALRLHAEDLGGFPRRGDPPTAPPEEGRFATLGNDRILGIDEPFAGLHAEFLRNAVGEIVYLRISGRLLTRQAR